MTPEQIKLVQGTWAQVAPAADQVANIFYTTLFEMEPGYAALFKGDMKEQGKKLMSMLGTAVSSLTRLESILPAVEELAVRHVDYGVKPEDYAVVGEALLSTLKTGLGEDYTDEVEEAWKLTYTTLVKVMTDAAYTPTKAVSQSM